MKYGVVIIFVTGLLVYNTYYENKLIDLYHKNKKYLKIVSILFTGLSLYTFIRKHPSESSSMLKHASGMIQYLPIDKNSKDLLTPFLDLTIGSQKRQSSNVTYNATHRNEIIPTTKRSVSETKKKYVASQQNWNCNKCNNVLDATFEIDHIIELQHGGTNDVSNLMALCRNCHGKKTLLTRM